MAFLSELTASETRTENTLVRVQQSRYRRLFLDERSSVSASDPANAIEPSIAGSRYAKIPGEGTRGA